MNRILTGLGVVGTCVLAACVFGIAHDLLSTQVCLEYFTVFHPKIIESQNPVILALTWGVVATWWMGFILGVGLAAAAVIGPYPPAEVRSIAGSVAKMLAGILVGAVIVWVSAYSVELQSRSSPPPASDPAEIEVSSRMGASYTAHNFSYFASVLAAMVIGARTYQKRRSLGRVRPE